MGATWGDSNIPISWGCWCRMTTPICSMYGIFTYKTGWFLGQMLVNIPYMEHMGHMTGWCLTYPSEKYDFVSWDDLPFQKKIWKMKNVPNHQPAIYIYLFIDDTMHFFNHIGSWQCFLRRIILIWDRIILIFWETFDMSIIYLLQDERISMHTSMSGILPSGNLT